ncbi:MAG: hypothetical protein ACFFFH_18530, partial [Candidatus Thorarchaeota archaeon]
PHKAGVTDYRTSCLGGWQLGLNVYSEHKDEAKEFMKWLTDVDQQKYYLLHGGQIPTRKAVYSDPEVLASDQAYVHELFSVFEEALPRPVHPVYPAISKAIWAPMHSYLAGAITLNDAVEKMSTDVNDILEELFLKTTTTETTTTETTSTETTSTELVEITKTSESSEKNGIKSIGAPGWQIGLLLSTITVILVWSRRKQ